LSRLQEIDDRIDRYERNLARLPKEIREIARNLVTTRREIGEAKERIEELEKEMRAKERDLNTEQEKIKVSERRLLNIKNQKEYNALSRQVKLGKRVVGEIEETVLEFMGESETLKKSLERKELDYAGFEKGLEEKKAEEQRLAEEAKKDLALLNKEKDKISREVERKYLKRYQTVKNALGSALAELEDGSCGACHIAIPPQLGIRVLKQEELILCPSCHRILFVRPENVPEYNKIEA
jgi:predicted  nucleic acid-binding Zn-ribbon protein